MIKRITLNTFTPHSYKQILSDLGIKQFDLAHSLGIQQSKLSRILNGIEEMPNKIENEIKNILSQFQTNKK